MLYYSLWYFIGFILYLYLLENFINIVHGYLVLQHIGIMIVTNMEKNNLKDTQKQYKELYKYVFIHYFKLDEMYHIIFHHRLWL